MENLAEEMREEADKYQDGRGGCSIIQPSTPAATERKNSGFLSPAKQMIVHISVICNCI